MIVSPGDVIRERQVIKDILHDWNSIHSESTLVVLRPIGWDINSYPGMGDHPQAILNRQLLDRADVLIGVFWTRIGTKTPEYDSGSVEEITKHIEAGRPALLYFSNVPVAPDSVDAEQYRRLIEYKNSIREEGYYHEYSDPNDFGAQLSKHIQLLVQDQLPGAESGGNTHELTDDTPATDRATAIIDALGEEACTILKEASLDASGYMLRLHNQLGLRLHTNGKEFGSAQRDPKVEAELEEILSILEQNGLIEPTSYKRQTFRVTAEGYRIAEQIDLNEETDVE